MSANNKEKFNSKYPNGIYLESNSDSILINYLKSCNFIKESDSIFKVEIAGQGNMNFVLRVVTNTQSIIVKQSRPWVEKYPSIEAPVERNIIESIFYKEISQNNYLAEHMPKYIGSDAENFILCIEDLGEATDYLSLYETGNSISDGSIKSLSLFLQRLHNLDINNFPSNMQMRTLNHEHIFKFPFNKENNFDLNKVQSGLAEIGSIYKNDNNLKLKINALGEIYLNANSGNLLHGDFYPGSWLKTEQGLKIIDPEFCFVGPREFDLGVFKAHMLLSKQDNVIIESLYKYYTNDFNLKLTNAFAGVEILRRILGIAQLPLEMTLKEKDKMCEFAALLINKY